MNILTKRKQKAIERDRDIIYKYIEDHPIKNPKDTDDVIKALVEIGCICGIWRLPYKMTI